jgi:type I restriction enzyme R subunit
MVNQTPEQKARDIIDARLNEAGWAVQDKKKIDFSVGRGIAVREYDTEVGPVDYALFVDRKAVGVIEAKPDDEGHRLTVVEEQSKGYAESKLKHINNDPLPFRYESTGVLTRFTDIRDPKPRSRPLFSFHRPETLASYLKDDKSLRARVLDLPGLSQTGLRDCQFAAINNLETSFKENRPRALIQMATGSGKTFTAITFVYRLLKFAKAKRILFLVDTKNLGIYAEQEFKAYQPVDDNRKFTELYNVTRLKSRFIPSDSQVYISTIQRLYSILRNKDMDEQAEELNPNEMVGSQEKAYDVVYNEKLPIEFFDYVIVDECHRSIYNLWKQVLDYFDAFLIGLTATPDKRTFGFFNKNIVSEYSHTQAVADGVNVGYDLFHIETKVTRQGAKIEAKEYVDRRERLTRKLRWEQLDEDEVYNAKDLDRDFVNPDQIRTVIRAFKENLPAIFPNRTEVPKTLVFAKTDSHADDIINIIREEFAESNDFCKKITYQTEENPETLLSDFRNAYYPRIAVTVDMIATGTDIRPLECLLFMRDVKSKNYYEQMLGRGTRTHKKDDLKKVTPSATTEKTHFVVVDAIGVSKSCKTDARPLEKKPSVPLKDLLQQVLMGSQDEEVFSSLACRLARIEKELTAEEKSEVSRLAKGKNLKEIVNALFHAHDPDVLEEKARKKFSLDSKQDPTPDQIKKAKDELTEVASTAFNGELNNYIEKVRRVHEQTIDRTNPDEVEYVGWGQEREMKATSLVTEFQEFIEANKSEITALNIIYNQPQRRKEITYKMIRELFDKLRLSKPNLAPVRVYEAYAALDKVKVGNPKSELIAIVSLVRRVCGIDDVLKDYPATVDRNFQDWVFRKQSGKVKYSKDQMSWLHMIKDHIASSFHIERDDLDLAPFDSQGGLAKMYDLFGPQMDGLISEMNEALIA